MFYTEYLQSVISPNLKVGLNFLLNKVRVSFITRCNEDIATQFIINDVQWKTAIKETNPIVNSIGIHTSFDKNMHTNYFMYITINVKVAEFTKAEIDRAIKLAQISVRHAKSSILTHLSKQALNNE